MRQAGGRKEKVARESSTRWRGKGSAPTIAKRLERTQASVVMRIKLLGHSRRIMEGYTIRDIELCLGEDRHKIQKWIANSWLRDPLEATRRHKAYGRNIHRSRENDTLGFIKWHASKISWGKVHQIWFLDVLFPKGTGFCENRLRRKSSPNDDAA